MKRIVVSMIMLSALIVTGFLYGAGAPRNQPLGNRPAAQGPSATVTLYDGNGKAIKAWQVLVEQSTKGPYCSVTRDGGFVTFTDSAGLKVCVSGTVLVEGAFSARSVQPL